MPKKVQIRAELLLDSIDTPVYLIEQTIRNEAKIPWCTSIGEIVIDDINDYCESLEKKGVSSNVVKNLIHHFYSE